MTDRVDLLRWVPAIGLSLLAVLLGVLAGAAPLLAIAAGLALVLLLLTLNSLTTGLVAFTLLSFLELVPAATGPTLSLAKLAGAVVAISWLASTTTAADRTEFPNAHRALTAFFVIYVGWNLLSMVWGDAQDRAVTSAASFALSFMLFPIVFAAVRSTREASYLVGAFVAGAALAAAYGIVSQPDASALAASPGAASGLNRIAGTIGDPNEFATLLVAGMALSTAFVFDGGRRPWVRYSAAIASAACLAGVLLTLSRGGLVALGAALLVGVLVSGRHRIQTLFATAAVVLASLFFYLSVASEEARERVTASDGGSGRTDIWDVGWRMVEDKPILGVGAGNFQISSIHYLIAPGGLRFDEYLVDQPAVAHNAYLQVLAETGIVGLALFCGIILACLWMAIRARNNFARDGNREGELLTRAVLVAVGAILAGIFFLSEEHSKHLWLLLSLGPALLAVSQRGRRV